MGTTGRSRKIQSVVASVLAVWVFAHLAACGNAGVSSDETVSLGPQSDILGSISSQSGDQADMQGWVICLIEKDTEIARVAEVSAAGLFTLKGVITSKVFTLVLISPAYVVSSVLSQPGTVANTVKQYFKIESKTLPRMIHKGPIVTLQNSNGLIFQKDAASDQNADGIPDGIANVIGIELQGSAEMPLLSAPAYDEHLGFNLTAPPKSTADIDNDGIKNILDPDIDGDGLPNVFDLDDDGDAIFDMFDQDSDGDLIPDAAQAEHDLYFPEGLDWISVKFQMSPKDDGTFKSTLTFLAKVSEEGLTPEAVLIRGAPSLLAGGNVETADSEGETTLQAWDRRLFDDGASEDAAPDDRLFARHILLEATKIPSFHQVIFFQLQFGKGENAWFMEFPYTFPPLTPKSIKSTYEKFSGQIGLTGNPFGDIQDFIWTASVYEDDELGRKVHTTEAKIGTERSVVLPSNIIEPGKTYTYKVTAQVLDRVPGFANYTIESSSQALVTE